MITDKNQKLTETNRQYQTKYEKEIAAESQLKDAADRARIGQIALRSLLLLPEQPDLSLLLGAEAVRRIKERDRQSYGATASDPASARARVVAFNALLGALQHMPEATVFFSPPGGEITAVAIRPDGRRAATVNRSGDLVITELSERRTVLGPMRLHRGSNGAGCVAYSSDGKTIATGGQDGTVAVVDAEKGKERIRFKPGSPVSSVTFLGGDQHVVFSAGTEVYRGKVADALMTVVRRTDGAINAFAVSPDGQRVVTSDAAKPVRFWNLDSGKEVPEACA